MDVKHSTTQPNLEKSFTSTTSATAEFHAGDQYSVSLKPLLVTVCSTGVIPRQLAHQQIPVKISVSLTEEHQSSAPVIEVIPWDISQSGMKSSTSDKMSITEEQAILNDSDSDSLSDNHVTVPFLPLATRFDFAMPLDWHLLSIQIEKWLISDVSVQSKYWAWGRDMFWLAFVATYPAFPRGKWRMWSSRIMPVGEFIEAWLSGNHVMQLTATRVTSEWRTQARAYIFDEFCRHASLSHLSVFHIPGDT